MWSTLWALNQGREREVRVGLGKDEYRHSLCESCASALASVSHCADCFFNFGDIHHDNRVPRAAIEETAVRTFAQALLATDAQNRIHLNTAERRMVLVRHPKHAVFHGAVFDTSWRSSTSGATLRNHREFFGFFLARRADPLRSRLVLHRFGHHSCNLNDFGIARHGFYLGSRPSQQVRACGKRDRICRS